MTQHVAIETILFQLDQGQLALGEATERLLAIERAESLASLSARLGSPPEDVVLAWCAQLRSIASAHEAATGEPLPEIDSAVWAVTSKGDLLHLGHRFRCSDDRPEVSQVSLDRINRFRSSWGPGNLGLPSRKSEADSNSVVTIAKSNAQLPAMLATADDQVAGRERASGKSMSRSSRAMLFGGIAALAAAVVAFLVLFRASPPHADSLAGTRSPHSSSTESPRTESPRTGDRASGFAPGGDRPGTDAPGESVALQTFGSNLSLESDLESEHELSMSLDGLMPSLDHPNPNRSESELKPSAVQRSTDQASDDRVSSFNRVPTNRSVDPPNSKSAEPVAGQIADEEPIPEESPQTIRRSLVMSVELPDPSDTDTSVALSEYRWTEPQISFPYDVPVEVTAHNDHWSIRDTKSNIILAFIRSPGDQTTLTWSETAKQSPVVAALASGRLTDATGSRTFLRPKFESDPWRFQFDRPDWMPTWNLSSAIPPELTRLDVQFRLPEDIEFGWVDPIDSSSPRRERGTAVINVSGDEHVSLAIRFDVRCNRKLSVRIRFAARLDPSMPWQIVSTPLLAEFANQLSDRALMIANEGERLAKVYRSLDRRDAKRYIRDKQDHVKALVLRNEIASKRVAMLQSLMARLESHAQIGFHLWIEWPDTEQTLLSAMPAGS